MEMDFEIRTNFYRPNYKSNQESDHDNDQDSDQDLELLKSLLIYCKTPKSLR